MEGWRGCKRAAPLALACALVGSLLTIVFGAPALARAPRRPGHSRHAPARLDHKVRTKADNSSATPPLVFGIYPGGAAGTVGPGGTTVPEDPVKRLAALEQLRDPGRPFVLHLYASYTGPGGQSAAQQVGQQIVAYGRAGFQTELALCYRPTDGGSTADVAGFVNYVRDSVGTLGPHRGFRYLQVTNEANTGGAPNASDGYYNGAEAALVQGVIAAKQTARKDNVIRLKIGFNWAYDTGPNESAFWSYLRDKGGRKFVRALDWVGFDAYPGTWGPPLAVGNPSAATVAFMDGALEALRETYMPLAGIPARVPLHVTENGYPTGPNRSEAMQATVMRAAVGAVYEGHVKYNISGYRWFDLRDADSSSSSFEGQYGLMRDDYSPKPAFGVYRELVAKYSAGRRVT
jgi:hypothetical protein